MKIIVCKKQFVKELPKNSYLEDDGAILFWTSDSNFIVPLNEDDYCSWSRRDGYSGKWTHGGWIFDLGEMVYRVGHLRAKMSTFCKECENPEFII